MTTLSYSPSPEVPVAGDVLDRVHDFLRSVAAGETVDNPAAAAEAARALAALPPRPRRD